MTCQAICTKGEYLSFLRARLKGIGSDSYKEMISEEIELIGKITETEFTDYFNKLQWIFNNQKEE